MDEALTCSALAWNPPSVDPLALLDETRHLPVIDVRSPGEFEKGHIPGALNVLIFDDCERAEIGTVYKRQGQAASIALGLEFSQSKVDQYVNSVRRITNGSSVRVHCWRGGMRSRGFSWLLAEDGFHPEILQGGYKAYRRAVQASFGDPLPIVILSGLSGAGKSRMLELLRREGEQVIDLGDSPNIVARPLVVWDNHSSRPLSNSKTRSSTEFGSLTLAGRSG